MKKPAMAARVTSPTTAMKAKNLLCPGGSWEKQYRRARLNPVTAFPCAASARETLRSKEEKVMGYSAPYWYFVTWKYFEIFPSGERKIRTTGWLKPWISFRKRKPTAWVNF